MPNHKEKRFQTPFEVPNQKYVLERRDQHGNWVKVETFDSPITTEYALGTYGPGEYFLKPCKPTFWKVLWHEKLGADQPDDLAPESTAVVVRSLERKTNNLAMGVVGLGIGTVVGWGLTGWAFACQDQRLNRLEALVKAQLRVSPVPPFNCPTCGVTLFKLFRNFCSLCGTKLLWPDLRKTSPPSEGICSTCKFPLGPGDSFCGECGGRVSGQLPATGWSLP